MKYLLMLLFIVCLSAAVSAQTLIAQGRSNISEAAAIEEAQRNTVETLCRIAKVPYSDKFNGEYSILKSSERDNMYSAVIKTAPDMLSIWDESENKPPLKLLTAVDSFFEGKSDKKEIGLTIILERLIRDFEIVRPELYKKSVSGIALTAKRNNRITEIAKKNGIYFVLFVSMAVSTEAISTDNEKRTKAVLSAQLKSSVTGKVIWSTIPALRRSFTASEGSLYERAAGDIAEAFYAEYKDDIMKSMIISYLTEKYYETRIKK